jgi:hypothetical protein
MTMSDKNIHTCHAECPCQTGGEPVSDFVEARTQPCPVCDTPGCPGVYDGPITEPETGQPIPDEAVEAVARMLIPREAEPFCNCSNPLSKAAGGCPTHNPSAYRLPAPDFAAYKPQAQKLLTAALPHLEVAWRMKGFMPLSERYPEHLKERAAEREAAIRADERAKVRERVEARLHRKPIGWITDRDILIYHDGLKDALTAIDNEGEQ